jgi:hypothetical protein
MAKNGSGKSDRSIGTEEPFEQRRERSPFAEEGEGRDLTKENLFQQNKYRTQDREGSGYGEPQRGTKWGTTEAAKGRDLR